MIFLRLVFQQLILQGLVERWQIIILDSKIPDQVGLVKS